MEPLSSPNDFQMVPCSKSSYVPLAPTGARFPGQTLPPQAHGHPGGGGSVLGRQLPPPSSLQQGWLVPAGSSGATWEKFSEIFSKNLIFCSCKAGRVCLFLGGIPGGTPPAPLTALTLRSRGTHLPFLHFFPTHFLLSLGDSGEPTRIPSPQHLCHWCVPPLLPLGEPLQSPRTALGGSEPPRALLSPPQPSSAAGPSKAEANKHSPR